MIGDCDNCGHSAMYHMPFVGCVKCDCEEFVVRMLRRIYKVFKND
jgi:predicted nucleic-acid-binding Zn-ribbon protein